MKCEECEYSGMCPAENQPRLGCPQAAKQGRGDVEECEVQVALLASEIEQASCEVLNLKRQVNHLIKRLAKGKRCR
jgi:hypothetical protein